MGYRRQTIIFALPLDIINGYPNLSGIISDNEYTYSDNEWIYIRMYINPQQFNISDKKLINTQLTKGGYTMQYWGEELSTIQIGGTTGSSGIEGIHILRSVYRHEQKQFKVILGKRLKELKEEANNAALNIASDLNSDYQGSVGGFLAGAADLFTGGLYSNMVNGFETLTDVITGDFSLPERKEYANFSTTPSLAYFASSVIIYYGGEQYRGFFTNFSVTESAQSPGLFDYNAGFTILERKGFRENFMPWHRSPRPSGGGKQFGTIMSKSSTSSIETSHQGLSVPHGGEPGFASAQAMREAEQGRIDDARDLVRSSFLPSDPGPPPGERGRSTDRRRS